MTPMFEFSANREEFILWRLIEDVGRSPGRVSTSPVRKCLDAVVRLPAIQAQSEIFDPSIFF